MFEGADPAAPIQAAESVVANMLLEVMGHVSRFSPWYKQPMGLRRIQDDATRRARWVLSPSTYRQWQALIKSLSRAIDKNIGLILAADLVDHLISSAASADNSILVVCECVPQRIVRVKRTFLDNANIVCDACQCPFRPIKAINSDRGNI